MHELYVSRYVNRPLRELADALGPRRVTAGRVTVDTGVAMRFHEHMWLIPVIGHDGAFRVLRGHFRVMDVCSGRRPVTELLLVGNAAIDVAALLDIVVDDLLDRATSGGRAGSSARCRRSGSNAGEAGARVDQGPEWVEHPGGRTRLTAGGNT